MRVGAGILSLAIAGPAFAQTLQCPEPPRQVANEVSGRVSADFSFVGRLTSADVGGRVQSQAANLFAAYPNADRIFMVQVMASMLCNLLRSSSLPDREKVDRFDQFFTRVTLVAFPAQAPVAVSPPVAPPQSSAPSRPQPAPTQPDAVAPPRIPPVPASPRPAPVEQPRAPSGTPAAQAQPAPSRPAASPPAVTLAPDPAPSRLVLDLLRYQHFQVRNSLSPGQVSETVVLDLEGGPRLNFQLGPGRREQGFLVAVPAGLDTLKYRLTGVTTQEAGASRSVINHRAEGTIFPVRDGRFSVELVPDVLGGSDPAGRGQARRSTVGTFLSPDRCTEESWRKLMGLRFLGRLLPSGRSIETSLYERNGRRQGSYAVARDGMAGTESGTLVEQWIVRCRAAFQWRDRMGTGHLVFDFAPDGSRFTGFWWAGSNPEPDEAQSGLAWDGRQVGVAASP